jgi:hypothetical protein
MRRCHTCGLPIDCPFELKHDPGCDATQADAFCLCDDAVHADCGLADSRDARVVEHLLEILHPDPTAALYATVVGAVAMARTCPLLEDVEAASRFEVLATLVRGACVADVQNWMRGHLSIGRTFANHWLLGNPGPWEAPRHAEWFRVDDLDV